MSVSISELQRKFREDTESQTKIFYNMPFPLEFFAPDGTSVFVNQAMMKLHNIEDPSLIVARHNILNDPLHGDSYGLKEKIMSVFGGETPSFESFNIPVKTFVDRNAAREKRPDFTKMDVFFYSDPDNKKRAFVGCVFVPVFQSKATRSTCLRFLGH